MKLYTSGPSPFVRKVRVAAHELDLDDRIELVPVVTTPVQPSELLRANPLAKIPTLELDDGSVLYDSHVIVEYLDELKGGARLLPKAGASRWETLRLEALADGMLDAAILVRYEFVLRPEEKRWDEWIAGQRGKVVAALDTLEKAAHSFGDRVDLGTISVASALAWLEFRKPVDALRDGRAELFAWYDRFAKRPSMLASEPKA